jgi:hypothetical protein
MAWGSDEAQGQLYLLPYIFLCYIYKHMHELSLPVSRDVHMFNVLRTPWANTWPPHPYKSTSLLSYMNPYAKGCPSPNSESKRRLGRWWESRGRISCGNGEGTGRTNVRRGAVRCEAESCAISPWVTKQNITQSNSALCTSRKLNM